MWIDRGSFRSCIPRWRTCTHKSSRFCFWVKYDKFFLATLGFVENWELCRSEDVLQLKLKWGSQIGMNLSGGNFWLARCWSKRDIFAPESCEVRSTELLPIIPVPYSATSKQTGFIPICEPRSCTPLVTRMALFSSDVHWNGNRRSKNLWKLYVYWGQTWL